MWFISGINFLEKITIEDLEQILKSAITLSIEKDKYFKPKPETRDKIWLLKTGTVKLIKKVEAKKDLVLSTLEQGELFGFYPVSKNVIELLFSPTGALFYLLQRNSIEETFKGLSPELFKVITNINGKKIEYTPEINLMLRQNYTERIMQALRLLAKEVGERKKAGLIIKGDGIIELIVKLSFMSPQAVILILSEMWKNGLIEIFKDKLIIKQESIWAE